jgi:hypothetical protein
LLDGAFFETKSNLTENHECSRERGRGFFASQKWSMNGGRKWEGKVAELRQKIFSRKWKGIKMEIDNGKWGGVGQKEGKFMAILCGGLIGRRKWRQ